MTKIGIDCRLAGTGTGLARYIHELVPKLIEAGNTLEWTLITRSKNADWFREACSSAEIVIANDAHYSLGEQLRVPAVLRDSGIDLLFSPHFNVPFFCPVPFVATIHDLILHRYPNAAPLWKRLAYRSIMRRTVQRATKIIAVSAFTAEELRAVYATPDDRVRVIPEACHPRFRPMSKERIADVRAIYELQKPYFLYVGNAKEHKNVPLLLAAFALSGLADTHELILISGGKEAKSLTLPRGVHRFEAVQDDDLPGLYTGAQAFVTASAYEGFCLPILEAHACGCPVIAVRGTAIPEVAADSDSLLPLSVEAFATAFKRPPGRHIPTNQRRWEDVAEETFDVLREALPME